MKFRRKMRSVPPPLLPPPPSLIEAPTNTSNASAKKKSRLWMRMDRLGQSELIDCDKSVIVKRVSVPARDFRILGPIFFDSASIHARKNAMIVNLEFIRAIVTKEELLLEFIRAIVTKEELLLLSPLQQEVLPFVDQLRRHLLQKNSSQDNMTQPAIDELPFEFEVLEMALEAVSTYLDSSVAELERDAYPALDEMVIRVSTKNLDHVRSLKCNLTRLLGQVQKVRDEIEHLLDDDEDMARLYLTQKWIHKQENDPLGATSNSIVTKTSNQGVEDLEMLLESYFLQLDSTRNKILSVREYIDDTEDYVNILLDNRRNELMQVKLTLTIASFAIGVETGLAGIFGMNFENLKPYVVRGLFCPVVGAMTAVSLLVFLLIFGYARYKKLL